MKDLLMLASQIAAMSALAHAGAFDELVRAPASAADLALRLTLNEGALRRALEVARAYGILRLEDGAYVANSAYPVEGEQVLALARSFPEHLRTGASLVHDNDARARLYAMATPMLGTMFRPSAEQLAAALAHLPCERILDVGAGSGVWSLAMAARHPRSRVTALDLDVVLARFREHARSGAHECIAGDYHEIVLEPRWDRVVLANVLHLEVPERARALLNRATGWRRAGGRLVVVDSMLRTDASDLALASYELHLALRVEGGCVHDDATVRGWARDAGLEVETAIVLDESSGWGALVLR